ncbi:MAG TPA: type II toxin-antitoxin system VapB family antitoxin [Terriglobales bacterium]|nr:type II toxin-antitoxin system VapB family antitoxin [Terriglobales bacterium]
MPTNLHIDSDLLEKAQRIGRHRTKRETVNEALREYIERRKRMESVDLFGSVEFTADFDYKKLRKAR